MSDKTVVVFRMWKAEPKGCFALFPFVPHDRNGLYCESYEHVGQHGGADYSGCIADSRPATPAEYAALKRELESPPYEYRLIVRKRKPRK
jgi:hypothetical protein